MATKKEKVSKEKILQVYRDFVKKYKRTPTAAELQKNGITRNATRWHFETVKNMKDAARAKYPKVFENIIDESLFTEKNLEKIQKTVGKYNRFIVTCAVTGCEAHPKLMKTMKSYCEKNNALMLVIPVTDPAAAAGWELDREIGKAVTDGWAKIAYGNLELNSNIYVSGIKMSAKQIDPTTGLDRLGHDKSFIYGSPKQRMKSLANAKHKYPHVSMGTGAITIPDYDTDIYMSRRTAFLADFDHKMGGIVVELEDDEIYHFRQIQAEPASGNFVDLGQYYKPSGKVSTLEAEAFMLGDWHAGETDPEAKKAWKEVVDVVKPKRLFLHDLFNGKSISHHDRKKVVSQAIKANEGKRLLRDELEITGNDMNELTTWTEDGCVVVYSNHDDFIFRWLDDGAWLKDSENFQMAVHLASAMLDGEMPHQAGIERFMTEAARNKTQWLQEDESFKVAGIEHGMHGHLGPKGARGTLQNLEKSYCAINIGHSHGPQILRDGWQGGTSSLLDQGFNKGASDWMHSSILTYPNGARQMINAIRGKWRRKKK